MPLVDPRVSRRKFDREIEQYRSLEPEYIARGWWLLRACFPEVVVVFGTPHRLPPLVAFGARLDFTNYDLWPPSVTLVNPFTLTPYRAKELPVNPTRANLISEEPTPDGVGVQRNVQMQPLAVAFSPDDIPFICLPGIREYHQNPAHTGNSWLLHRGTGEGTLYFLLEQLWKYAVRPLALRVQFGVMLVAQDIPQ